MTSKPIAQMRLREQSAAFDRAFGPLPNRIEWLRLKPSGYVHAFDAAKPPKRAMCGRENNSGTTNDFPPAAVRCEICTDMAEYIQAVKRDQATP